MNRVLLSVLSLVFFLFQPVHAGGSPETLKEAVDSARRHQFNFRDREGARILEEALSRIAKELPTPEDASALVEAHLLAASCHQNVGDRRAMNRYLEEATRLNPALEPSELNYPPSFIAQYEKVRRSFYEKEKPSQILVDSRPSGARIFVNGVYKGKGPLRLERFPPGAHFLYATRDDGEVMKKISLREGESLEVTLRLKKKGSSRFRVGDFQSI